MGIYWRHHCGTGKKMKNKSQNKGSIPDAGKGSLIWVLKAGRGVWPFHDNGSNMIISNSTNKPTPHNKQH
jgi:hypothetical protein